MKIKEKIKKYFTEKPKTDFWKSAFVTLFIFQFISPLIIMFFAFFSVGLVAPGIENSSQVFQKCFK